MLHTPTFVTPAIAAALFWTAAAVTAGPHPEHVLRWTDADRAAQREAGQRMLRRLRDANARGEERVVIEPGDYRFAGAACVLNGLTDLVIEAEGVNLWFEDHDKVGLKIQNSRDVTVRGLTIDYDPLPFSQGVITAVDRDAKSIDVRLDAGYPALEGGYVDAASRTRNLKAIFFGADGERMSDVRFDWTKGIQPLSDRAYRVTFDQGFPFVHATSPGTVKPGDRFVFPWRRHQPAFDISRSERITLEGVTVYTSPAMGIVEGLGEGGHVYRGCRVVRRPGTDRLISTVADAFHSLSVARGPLVEGCEFAYACDDLIAIHGFFSVVLEQRSPTELVVASVFRGDFDAGAHVRFVDVARGTPCGANTVRRVTPITDPAVLDAARRLPRSVHEAWGVHVRGLVRIEPQLVELAAPLEVPAFALVASSDRAGAGAVVRGNRLHDGRVRGVFLRSHGAVIEGNRIERTGMAGVSLTPDRFFLEGPFARRVSVRGNTLVDCGATVLNQHYVHRENVGAVTVATDFGPRFSPVTAHRDVSVTGNTIVRPAGPGVYLANVDGGVVEGNTIERPFAKLDAIRAATGDATLPRFDVDPTEWADLPVHAVSILASEHVRVSGNVVRDAPAELRSPVGYGPWARAMDAAAPAEPTAP